jgi:hypothetical protein
VSTIRVTDPLDLVTVLPYQLGYHPSDSLALVGLRGRRLEVVQRVDLPSRPDARKAEATEAAAEIMASNLVDAGCATAIVIRYESHAGQGAPAGAVLAQRLREGGIDVVDHLVVRAGRVYFPECQRGCHPPDGVPLPADADVAAVAEFVALGANPLPSRDWLAERVAPSAGPTATRVRAAAARLARRSHNQTLRASAMADWARLFRVGATAWEGPPTSAAAAARMAVSLRDIPLRDLLTGWLCPGTLSLEALDPELVALARAHLPAFESRWRAGDREPPQLLAEPGGGGLDEAGVAYEVAVIVERLCWLARECPEQLAPGVLTVLASYAWFHGDGALASVALDRALAIDPAYRLALLLEQMVSLAIRPQHPA